MCVSYTCVTHMHVCQYVYFCILYTYKMYVCRYLCVFYTCITYVHVWVCVLCVGLSSSWQHMLYRHRSCYRFEHKSKLKWKGNPLNKSLSREFYFLQQQHFQHSLSLVPWESSLLSVVLQKRKKRKRISYMLSLNSAH